MANYIDREVKRRAFVMSRWDFREKEKMELDLEAKRKAGVSSIMAFYSWIHKNFWHWLFVSSLIIFLAVWWPFSWSYVVFLPICEEGWQTFKNVDLLCSLSSSKLQTFLDAVSEKVDYLLAVKQIKSSKLGYLFTYGLIFWLTYFWCAINWCLAHIHWRYISS